MTMYKHKPGPTGGETLTVTCFTCGMPSSKEWAQKVFARPSPVDRTQPFYPFLLEMQNPPSGALFMEDASTFLCAFCYALLETQWDIYEGKTDIVPPLKRKYVIHKFICAVCGVETYRRRVRALPFQEFPFLAKGRQPGSITLGNNPLAVVCLDCSETLWAQSAEYDRWGLPVHKRHFNWMARPPPPEDSVEASVARLPSGETQLPRCPPTEPLVPPKSRTGALPEPILPIKPDRSRTSSLSSSGSGGRCESVPHMSSNEKYTLPHPGIYPRGMATLVSGKKGRLGCMDALEGGSVHPPIVTVAPIAPQAYGVHHRKNPAYSISTPPDKGHFSQEVVELPCGRGSGKHADPSHLRLMAIQYGRSRRHAWPINPDERAIYDEDCGEYMYPTEDIDYGPYLLPWRLGDQMSCSEGHILPAGIRERLPLNDFHDQIRSRSSSTTRTDSPSQVIHSAVSSVSNPRNLVTISAGSRYNHNPNSNLVSDASWEEIGRRSEEPGEKGKSTPSPRSGGQEPHKECSGGVCDRLPDCMCYPFSGAEPKPAHQGASRLHVTKKELLLPKKRHWDWEPSEFGTESTASKNATSENVCDLDSSKGDAIDLTISPSTLRDNSGLVQKKSCLNPESGDKFSIAYLSKTKPDSAAEKSSNAETSKNAVKCDVELPECDKNNKIHMDSDQHLTDDGQSWKSNSSPQLSPSGKPVCEVSPEKAIAMKNKFLHARKGPNQLSNHSDLFRRKLFDSVKKEVGDDNHDGKSTEESNCTRPESNILNASSIDDTKYNPWNPGEDSSGDKGAEYDDSEPHTPDIVSLSSLERDLQTISTRWKRTLQLLSQVLSDASRTKPSTQEGLNEELSKLQSIRKLLQAHQSETESAESFCKDLEEKTSVPSSALMEPEPQPS